MVRLRLKLKGFFAFNATGSGKSIAGVLGVLTLLVVAFAVGGSQVLPFALLVFFYVVYVLRTLDIQRRRASSSV